MAWAIFQVLIFPGFLFLGLYSLVLEFLDRKLVARFQNRSGPPWFQPLADFLKLLGKEVIIPFEADRRLFLFLPVVSLAAVSAAFLYIPIFSPNSILPFHGDLIVIIYLLTIPTVCFFLAGWYSTSVYATIGSVRALTQLFSYEIPLAMSLLAPALLADTWSVSGIAAYYAANPLLALVNIPAFIVALITCQGKLERVPFDLPEAETEIVSGAFVEYSGRLYAIFHMTINAELVVVASLIAAVFLPFYSFNPVLGFILYLLKTMAVLFILALFKSAMARIRIEQMVQFCWRYLTPLAILQIVINIILKGVL